MKKMTALTVLTVLALGAVLVLGGCSAGSITYANSDKYSAGDAEFSEKIENIEIDWASGSVSVVTHAGDTVILSEETESSLPEDLRVHWWLDGATLRVRFTASGADLKRLATEYKALTLTVPERLSFGDVTVRAASADVDAGDISAETLSVSTASGRINVRCEANSTKLKSASGSILLVQTGEAGEISLNSASGSIDASVEHAHEAALESTSGSISLSAGAVGSLTAKGASGAVYCDLGAVPDTCKLSSASGSVTLLLPESAGFTATVKTGSGGFESDFALKTQGGTYISGDGSADVSIKTASGGVAIWQK